jgi:hypothetical protein
MAQKVIRNAKAPKIIPMIGPESNAIWDKYVLKVVDDVEVATIRRKEKQCKKQ